MNEALSLSGYQAEVDSLAGIKPSWESNIIGLESAVKHLSSQEENDEINDAIGNCLYYLARLATVQDQPLGAIAHLNLAYLKETAGRRGGSLQPDFQPEPKETEENDAMQLTLHTVQQNLKLRLANAFTNVPGTDTEEGKIETVIHNLGLAVEELKSRQKMSRLEYGIPMELEEDAGGELKPILYYLSQIATLLDLDLNELAWEMLRELDSVLPIPQEDAGG